ncbi:unnamed protein product, partial [Mesorhabditis belari]|uniref:Uncharacterized protein n=1 Tax=Mesorhabditis belari TaxID=2138241 RepID=A0AAF3F174_9BILA
MTARDQPARSKDGFFDVVSDLVVGLINSTGGPIVILLFILALSIIVYAGCSLYRMCREEFRNGQEGERKTTNSEMRRPLPRRVYEIQAEEGVLDGVFVGSDDSLDCASKSPIWKPALPLEAIEEFERFEQNFDPSKEALKKRSIFFCFRLNEEGIDYV